MNGGVLSRPDILREIESGNITIDPFEPNLVGVDSIDIRLGENLEVPDFFSTKTESFEHQSYHIIDVKNGIIPKRHRIKIAHDQPYKFMPGSRVLASSLEVFGSTTCMIELDGKSTRARAEFIQIHATAKTIHIGHKLSITFEMFNNTPNVIYLWYGEPIAQILFYPVSSIPEELYNGNYGHGQDNFDNQLSHLPPQTS
jgi:dCTP deaminase